MQTDDRRDRGILHSKEYFGESRDYWWNKDFLTLMAKRLDLESVKTALDVGCGIGHWGQILSQFFSSNASLFGVDREPLWVEKARQRASSSGIGHRCEYQVGAVEKLPFEDASFDLVTCQTLLIHLQNPRIALREMLRVTAKGGTLLIVEPNNLANRAVGSNLTESLTADEVAQRWKFGLIVERGKKALGLGYNSFGDLVAGYLAELKLENLQVYLSDKATPFFPPYGSPEQKANIVQMKEWTERDFLGWSREELSEYFIAGGGNSTEFQTYCDMLKKDAKQTIESIENGTFYSSGGAMTYLVCGRKPCG